MLDHAGQNAFIFACIAMLALATGYLLKQWANNVNITLNAAIKNVADLTAMVGKLQGEINLYDQRIDFLEKDLARMASKQCSYDACPLKEHETNPGVRRV